MYIRLIVLLALLFSPLAVVAKNYPIAFVDSVGSEIVVSQQPIRVVSLVPSITEILLSIGAGQSVVGITHQSALSPETDGKAIVGGFLSPDLKRVAELDPDIIFYSGIRSQVPDMFGSGVLLVNLTAGSIEESFSHISLLGRMFSREMEAETVISEQRRLMSVISDKTGRIPEDKKLRVIRLMGRDSVMVPGDDSFQNEYIRKAGGIAPEFGRNGNVIQVERSEWQQFNPQVIYGCGNDRKTVSLLQRPGWNEVDAVRNNRVLFFPCELTCRASTHSGYFVSWLSARLYPESFSEPDQQVLPDQVISREPLGIDFEYIESAERIESDIRDFRNRSVMINFNRPVTVLSSLEGWRENIRHVGNHYFPPPAWGLGHQQGLESLRNHTLGVLGQNGHDTAMLFTGADMNNLAITSHSYKDMRVTALVTAGVLGNAVRMAADAGSYYELASAVDNKKPGTINILLFTNTTLSPRAMTRAIISATEAKSAALQDMDIRSSYSSGRNPATGTGTDNILVVQGSGPVVDATGGHTKMGELLAKAVYEGVTEAVWKQNKVAAGRSVFQRLRERKISLRQLSREYILDPSRAQLLERLLLNPQYQSFVYAALTISDAYERGLIDDLSAFRLWSRDVAEEISGNKVELIVIEDQAMPLVFRIAFGALISGINAKN